MKNPYQNTDKAKKLASMIRVNQAGEYGAKRIYFGQLAILKNHKEITKMLESELKHLEYFNSQVKIRKIRPTVLQPLWHVGGFAMGAISALIGGEKAAMALTVGVEEVIGEHYGDQLAELKNLEGEEDLTKHISDFRDEELEHKDIGLEHGADRTPGYEAIKFVAKGITKVAIFLSKRL